MRIPPGEYDTLWIVDVLSIIAIIAAIILVIILIVDRRDAG